MREQAQSELALEMNSNGAKKAMIEKQSKTNINFFEDDRIVQRATIMSQQLSKRPRHKSNNAHMSVS